METEYLNLSLTSTYENVTFSRQVMDENMKRIDGKIKEIDETPNVDYVPTEEELEKMGQAVVLGEEQLETIANQLSDSQLETMGESVVLTEEQIQTFLGDVELTESQLASIINGADEETLQEIADKINLSVSDLQGICEKLSDSQLEKMGESVSLTEEQIQTFLGEVELTESQLASIVNGANQETLQEIADKINLSVSDLQSICEKLSDSQLEKMGESVSLTEEQIQAFLGEVELTESQLASIVNGANQETLQEIADKMQLSVSDLQGICEKLSDSQLEKMGESVSLTEEQIQTFLGEVELTESQLATIINGADEETLQEIADKINLSMSDLQSICEKLSDSQLEKMGESVSLTEEQIQTFLGEVELTDSQLASIVNGANQETLQEIADKIEFSDEIIASFKGEKGDDGETAEFTPEQEALIEAAILGATEKQIKLVDLPETTEFLKETDKLFVEQDGDIKKISPVDVATYINSLSPLPESGRSLDNYTWSEIWQIAQLGKMEEYFQIGDRKTWVCNAVSTTVQIAGFWHDVKNPETGQRANVSFVLNDYAFVGTDEISKHFDSSTHTFTQYDVACLSLRDVMWTDGAFYNRLISDGFGEFITPVYKNSYGGTAAVVASSTDQVSSLPFAFFPLGYYDVYVNSTLYTDRYSGASVNHHYPLLTSAGVNLNILMTNKSGTFYVACNIGTASSAGRFVSSTGSVTTAASVNLNTTMDATREMRNIGIGFSMG